MKALTGYVKRARAKFAIIRLDNGGEFKVIDPTLERGDKVEIDFNYTNNTIGKIWKVGERPVPYEPSSKPVIIEDDIFNSACESMIPRNKTIIEDDFWSDIPIPRQLHEYGLSGYEPSSLPLVEGDLGTDSEPEFALPY